MRDVVRLGLVCTVLAGSWSGGARADIGVVRIPEGRDAIWLRHVQRLPAAGADQVSTLRIVGRGHVSVYLNGQRLLRQQALNADEVLRLDVTELIRSGANGFAVSIHRSQKDVPGSAACWLSHNGAEAVVATGGHWKQRDSVPPIGWERTDFNPHGWQDVAALQPARHEERDGLRSVEVPWKKPAVSMRFEDALRFHDGDHVLLLGGTFIERAQQFGHMEAMLTSIAHPARVTFRNLGWSGDTVFAESRGMFAPASKGFERLVEHVRAEEPTLVLICYGQNEAMADASSAQRFDRQLRKLCDQLQTTGARLLLVTPHPLMYALPPVPSPNRYNPAIETFAIRMQQVAKERDLGFADLFSDFPAALRQAQSKLEPDQPTDLQAASAAWTEQGQGLHWNEAGYKRMGLLLAERSSGASVEVPSLAVDCVQRLVSVAGGEVRDVQWSEDGGVRFDFRPGMLTPAGLTMDVTCKDSAAALRQMTVTSSDGGMVRLAGSSPDTGRLQFAGTADPQYEELRELIVRKNELYFHRWRPQNITYLYGFRKHEQGNNAAEIAQFDPLVAELEQQIQSTSIPAWRTITVR